MWLPRGNPQAQERRGLRSRWQSLVLRLKKEELLYICLHKSCEKTREEKEGSLRNFKQPARAYCAATCSLQTSYEYYRGYFA